MTASTVPNRLAPSKPAGPGQGADRKGNTIWDCCSWIRKNSDFREGIRILANPATAGKTWPQIPARRCPKGRRHRVPERQAMVLVCMLVCVAIATSLVTATLQSALHARHELRLQRQLRQTELLLTAGLERALARLRSDATYTGETWELDPATLPGLPPGQVRIEILPGHGEDDSSNRPEPRQIHVVARLSSDDLRGTQRSDTLTLDIPVPPTQE